MCFTKVAFVHGEEAAPYFNLLNAATLGYYARCTIARKLASEGAGRHTQSAVPWANGDRVSTHHIDGRQYVLSTDADGAYISLARVERDTFRMRALHA